MPPLLVNSQCCLQVRQRILPRKFPSFSTTSARHAQIPPESPRFIKVPRLVQPKQPFPTPVKGSLPPPRDIFARKERGKLHNSSPEYVAAVTPERLVERATRTDDEFLNWKARQSEVRRRNLREGLTELRERKMATDRRQTTLRAANFRAREKLLYAPERKDVELTSPSVLSSQQPTKYHGLRDPTRSDRLAAKAQNVADMAAMREEARRNALHTLYVNAGDFITTDKRLDEVVDRAFDDMSQFRSDSGEGQNIWNLGFPETAQQLLRQASKGVRKSNAVESAEGNEIVTRQRMRKISEELTGGKTLDEV